VFWYTRISLASVIRLPLTFVWTHVYYLSISNRVWTASYAVSVYAARVASIALVETSCPTREMRDILFLSFTGRHKIGVLVLKVSGKSKILEYYGGTLYEPITVKTRPMPVIKSATWEQALTLTQPKRKRGIVWRSLRRVHGDGSLERGLRRICRNPMPTLMHCKKNKVNLSFDRIRKKVQI